MAYTLKRVYRLSMGIKKPHELRLMWSHFVILSVCIRDMDRNLTLLGDFND